MEEQRDCELRDLRKLRLQQLIEVLDEQFVLRVAQILQIIFGRLAQHLGVQAQLLDHVDNVVDNVAVFVRLQTNEQQMQQF